MVPKKGPQHTRFGGIRDSDPLAGICEDPVVFHGPVVAVGNRPFPRRRYAIARSRTARANHFPRGPPALFRPHEAIWFLLALSLHGAPVRHGDSRGHYQKGRASRRLPLPVLGNRDRHDVAALESGQSEPRSGRSAAHLCRVHRGFDCRPMSPLLDDGIPDRHPEAIGARKGGYDGRARPYPA